MKDLRTTMTGLLAGGSIIAHAVITAYLTGQFTGETGWNLVIGVLIVALGKLSSDSKKTVTE